VRCGTSGRTRNTRKRASGSDERSGETGSGAAEVLDGDGDLPCDAGRVATAETLEAGRAEEKHRKRARGGDTAEMRARDGGNTSENRGAVWVAAARRTTSRSNYLRE
jgi:hypothetical protein